MDIITVLDLTNIILILLGIITICTTGIISKKFNLNKSFVISVTGIFVGGFLLASSLTTIEQMRYVVLSLFLFVIFPWIIAYIVTWMFSQDTTSVRINLSTFISWWLGLIIITTIRIFSGWGFESIWALIFLGLFLSLSNGVISGIISTYLISQIEKINPTQ